MSLTSLPSGVLQLRVSSNHDDFHHETVAALSDHVDHLPMTNFHHILAVDLTDTKIQNVFISSTEEHQRDTL